MKRFIFIIFSLTICLPFILFSEVHAQGTYGCMIQVGIGGSICTPSGSSSCQTGYKIGNSCSSLSLNSSSPNYCESPTAAPQCDQDLNYGGSGEPCRQNGVCDSGLSCSGGQCSNGGGIAINVLCPNGGINTAIGCIPFEDSNELTQFFLRWALGISGGIAILLIIYASFTIITSTGDPRRMQGGKELLTSAIAGVMLIIFSVFILRILGVNILGIF